MAGACPSCGSLNIEQRAKPSGFVYWYCNNCGAKYFTPMPVPESAAEPADLSLNGEVLPAETLE